MYIYAHSTSRWPVYIFYLIGYSVRDAGRARRQVLNLRIDVDFLPEAGADVVSAPDCRLAQFVTRRSDLGKTLDSMYVTQILYSVMMFDLATNRYWFTSTSMGRDGGPVKPDIVSDSSFSLVSKILLSLSLLLVAGCCLSEIAGILNGHLL